MLAEKLRRALENKCYQDKRKSVEGDHFQFEAKKEKEIIFLAEQNRGHFKSLFWLNILKTSGTLISTILHFM